MDKTQKQDSRALLWNIAVKIKFGLGFDNIVNQTNKLNCTYILLYNYTIHCTIKTRAQSGRKQHEKRTSEKVKW